MLFHAKNSRIPIGDTGMNYISFGRGPQNLILIPGLGDGLRSVRGLALPFAAMYRCLVKDYTVYSFSRRDHLPMGFTTRDMASDLAYAMKEAGIEVPFIDDVIADQEKERDEFRNMVSKYFAKVDVIGLQSSFRYDKADDLLLKMKDTYEGQEKFFAKNADKIKAYFEEKLEEKGEILITCDSHFLHCYI